MSENQFIALKVYPREMRRARAEATRGEWGLAALRAIGCVSLVYLGLRWGSGASGFIEAALIYLLFAGALSLFLTTGSYLAFRFDRALWWHDVGGLARKHDDYAPFLRDGMRLGLLCAAGSAESDGLVDPVGIPARVPASPTQQSAAARPDSCTDALRAHMRAYSVARLNAMTNDSSLSQDARRHATEELQRRST